MISARTMPPPLIFNSAPIPPAFHNSYQSHDSAYFFSVGPASVGAPALFEEDVDLFGPQSVLGSRQRNPATETQTSSFRAQRIQSRVTNSSLAHQSPYGVEFSLVHLVRQSKSERAASRLLMSIVEDSFKKQDLPRVNEMLQQLPHEDLGELPTAALYRSVYRARKLLPAWQESLRAARKYFDAKGFDTDDLLGDLD